MASKPTCICGDTPVVLTVIDHVLGARADYCADCRPKTGALDAHHSYQATSNPDLFKDGVCLICPDSDIPSSVASDNAALVQGYRRLFMILRRHEGWTLDAIATVRDEFEASVLNEAALAEGRDVMTWTIFRGWQIEAFPVGDSGVVVQAQHSGREPVIAYGELSDLEGLWAYVKTATGKGATKGEGK